MVARGLPWGRLRHPLPEMGQVAALVKKGGLRLHFFFFCN